jgi:hypothetical protein
MLDYFSQQNQESKKTKAFEVFYQIKKRIKIIAIFSYFMKKYFLK